MKTYALSLLLCSLLVLPTHFYALPSSVLVIRHVEKDNTVMNGFASTTGWTRAGALVGYFGGNATVSNTAELNISANPPIFPPPYALHAPRANPDPTRSKRVVDTLIPLANALRIPLHTCFVVPQIDEEPQMVVGPKIAEFATFILTNPDYDGKEILIAYTHNELPTLINYLITLGGGSELNLANYPGSRYDLVYVIDYPGHTSSFIKPATATVNAGGGIFLTVTIQELIFNDPSTVPSPPFPLHK